MPVYSTFLSRHVGAIGAERQKMLQEIGYQSMEALIDDAVPAQIRLSDLPELPDALSETQALAKLKEIMGKNQLLKSCIGQGYYGTTTPNVILRNVFENPGWYTAYTPYQAEIAQGRLEALMNFQTMIVSLTGLDVANASLLDEGTAAAEAMTLAQGAKPKAKTIFIADSCNPQTIDVVKTRAEPLGINVVVENWQAFDIELVADDLFAVVVQYPDTLGKIFAYDDFFARTHTAKALCITIADPLALCVLREPSAFDTDICIGSTQRFGIPIGFGGPHAAFMACKDSLKRRMPGRLVGISVDSQGRPGYRLSLQTREQHIRRDKATSNICTAQVLLAVMASMYAVYHGPEGLQNIAETVHRKTAALASALKDSGMTLQKGEFFDTIVVNMPDKAGTILETARQRGYNFRRIDADNVGISFDETTCCRDIVAILDIFGVKAELSAICADADGIETLWHEAHDRRTEFCKEKVFNSFHSETEMMRYLKRLESKDLALNEAMIPLGSCTMKLNAAAEMMPLSWPEVSQVHPFVPEAQSVGYREMLDQLSSWLAKITGFAAVSLQPNAGSQGEYAGLLAIRHYLLSQGQTHRDLCLVPTSAHGTNPASAAMVGMKIVPIACDEQGNINVVDLKEKAEKYKENLAALMITYPSTHGVYEDTIIDICATIHANGGQVYMDGANMNAQVCLTSPGRLGADVCHLNLHKTFAIPHGGGGPGVGPIGVAAHLVPFLPGHASLPGTKAPVCSAAFGSASVNTISWMYIAMMGTDGLLEATSMAILNANYIAKKLNSYFPVLYTGNKGLVAHECILDIRPLSDKCSITVEDVAKRLMDYGFHAPTMSWPVGGTLMVEPTESESKEELDRFIEAMIQIHTEIMEVVEGKANPEDNVLKNAPHTAEMLTADQWTHAYSRQKAAYPVARLLQHKFWPRSGRVDNVHGDRNLICSCDTIEAYTSLSH